MILLIIHFVVTGTATAGTAGLDFFRDGVSTLSTITVAIGAGLAIWGIINLFEGFSNDNPNNKNQGIKQLIGGGGIALIGILLIPKLANML